LQLIDRSSGVFWDVFTPTSVLYRHEESPQLIVRRFSYLFRNNCVDVIV
jgi:hypothetical protein